MWCLQQWGIVTIAGIMWGPLGPVFLANNSWEGRPPSHWRFYLTTLWLLEAPLMHMCLYWNINCHLSICAISVVWFCGTLLETWNKAFQQPFSDMPVLPEVKRTDCRIPPASGFPSLSSSCSSVVDIGLYPSLWQGYETHWNCLFRWGGPQDSRHTVA